MAPKIQWPLVLFSMLAGCGGCAFAFAGIANAMGESISVTLFVTIVAFVLVVVGAICSMMHLATPKHAFAAVAHLLSFSGISVELIMLGVVCALMALFAGSIVFIGNATATLVLGMLGALSGVVLAFVTGHGYLISSKPTWNTKKLPLAYTGTAAVAGGFLYVAIAGFAGADPAIVRALCWILLGCVAFSAVFSVAWLRHLGADRVRQNLALCRWGIVVCGLVIPVAAAVALAIMPINALFGVVTGFGLVTTFAGGIALRVLMWVVGAGFLFFFEEAQANRSAILNV